jgi:hypothetical protein
MKSFPPFCLKKMRPKEKAFYNVCLRLPIGGGKDFLGKHIEINGAISYK